MGLKPAGLRGSLRQISTGAILPPNSGGTHQWNITDDSDNTIDDSIGSLSGSLQGDPQFNTGEGAGKLYLQLDGNGDYVDFGSASESELSHWIGGNGTFFQWVRMQRDDSVETIVGGSFNDGKNELTIRKTSGNELRANLSDGNGFANASGGSLTQSDGWTPIAITADGSTLEVFIGDSNNNLQSVATDTIGSSTEADLSDPLRFGRQTNGSGDANIDIDISWFDSTARTQSNLQDFVDDSEGFY